MIYELNYPMFENNKMVSEVLKEFLKVTFAKEK